MPSEYYSNFLSVQYAFKKHESGISKAKKVLIDKGETTWSPRTFVTVIGPQITYYPSIFTSTLRIYGSVLLAKGEYTFDEEIPLSNINGTFQYNEEVQQYIIDDGVTNIVICK